MPCSQVAPATSDHSTDHAVWRRPADVPLARLVDAARAGCPGAWRAVVERFDDELHAIGRGYGLDAATVDDARPADLALPPSPTSPRYASRRRCPGGCAASCTGSASRRRTGRSARSRSSSSILVSPSRPHTSRSAAPRRRRPRTRRSGGRRSRRCGEAVRERLSAREQQLMTLLSDAQEHSVHRHRPCTRRPHRQHRPHPGPVPREAAPAARRMRLPNAVRPKRGPADVSA